jgi:hypothetical protein
VTTRTAGVIVALGRIVLEVSTLPNLRQDADSPEGGSVYEISLDKTAHTPQMPHLPIVASSRKSTWRSEKVAHPQNAEVSVDARGQSFPNHLVSIAYSREASASRSRAL